MVVALTARHFRDLTELTGTTKAVAAPGRSARARTSPTRASATSTATCSNDCSRHGSARTPPREVSAALSATSVLWERYRTFDEVAEQPAGDGQPAVHRRWISTGSAAIWHPACRCRSTARTPRPPRRPHSVQDNAAVPAEWLGRMITELCSRSWTWHRRRGRRSPDRPTARPASGPTAGSWPPRRWRRPAAPCDRRPGADRGARAVPARRRCRRAGALRASNGSTTGAPRPRGGCWAARATGCWSASPRCSPSRRPGRSTATAVGDRAIPSSCRAPGRSDRRRRSRLARSTSASATSVGHGGIRPPAVVAGHRRRCPTTRCCTPASAVYVTDIYGVDPVLAVHGHSMTDRSHHAATTDSSTWFHRDRSAPTGGTCWSRARRRRPAGAE